MRHCHEFAKCRTALYGMIRRFEVSNFEFNELGAVICAEGDWKNFQWSGRGAAGSTDMISWRSSFCSCLELKSPSPPKMTLTVFEASWNFGLRPWSCDTLGIKILKH
jgi:hypothetical protein